MKIEDKKELLRLLTEAMMELPDGEWEAIETVKEIIEEKL